MRIKRRSVAIIIWLFLVMFFVPIFFIVNFIIMLLIRLIDKLDDAGFWYCLNISNSFHGDVIQLIKCYPSKEKWS
jgi:hypothetical protein